MSLSIAGKALQQAAKSFLVLKWQRPHGILVQKKWPCLMLHYAMAMLSSHPATLCLCYARYVTSGDPDTQPDRCPIMQQPHVRWDVWCCSIIMRLCVSAFILIMSVGSAACLLAVENVIGDRLITKWNNSGNKRSDLGKAIRSRLSWFKALLLWTEVSNLFLAFGQWLYLGEMENKGFVHRF